MSYKYSSDELDDPIFDLSLKGFLKKYRKQIGESNLDRNVKNYIIESLKDYSSEIYDKEFKYLESLITKILQLALYPDHFGKDFGSDIILDYCWFSKRLSYPRFKNILKKCLEDYKVIAEFNIKLMYYYTEAEDNDSEKVIGYESREKSNKIINDILDKITYELLLNKDSVKDFINSVIDDYSIIRYVY